MQVIFETDDPDAVRDQRLAVRRTSTRINPRSINIFNWRSL